jgi:two-component system, OmpR family, alkaline phosphatase synthesis response regulator PhoP
VAQKVLLVDDVNMFLELEKSFLQRSAVNVLTARNGKEALSACRNERPALVFMDLHMPVMDGAECCKAIKKDPALSGITVVLITTEGNEAGRQLCLEAGCDEFMTKPLDRHLFLEAARRLVPGIDRREKRVECRVKLKFRTFGITFSGVTADVSRNGLYLASTLDIDRDAEIDLVFALPEPVGTIIHTRGRVAWLNTAKSRKKVSLPEGFGVEFLSISEEAARELDRFLDLELTATSRAWKAS